MLYERLQRVEEALDEKMPTGPNAKDCRPFHGLAISLLCVPGAYAPGFMRPPAPQAEKQIFPARPAEPQE